VRGFDRLARLVDQPRGSEGEHRIAVAPRDLDEPAQPLRVIGVVGVKYRQPAAAGQRQAAVDGGVRAGVFLRQHADARVVELAQRGERAVGRAIVDGDQFPVLPGLRDHAAHRRADEALVVVGGQDDRDGGGGHFGRGELDGAGVGGTPRPSTAATRRTRR
jgi:hypothetical protein